MLSDRVKDRLLNWKFAQAKALMQDDIAGGAELPAEDQQDTVNALAVVFGNVGWFGYADHDGLAQIVRAAVWYLGVTDPGDEAP
jgi:hypothetical protein